jgi:hypothetical protein
MDNGSVEQARFNEQSNLPIMLNAAGIGSTYDGLMHLFSGSLDANLEAPTAKDMVVSHDYIVDQWETRSPSKSAETYLHSLEHLERLMSASV